MSADVEALSIWRQQPFGDISPPCSTQSHCKRLPCTAQCGGKWAHQEEGEAHAVLCSVVMQQGLFLGNVKYVPNVITAIQKKINKRAALVQSSIF